MVKDRIVVFNRLVDKEIADCSVFEELLETTIISLYIFTLLLKAMI